MSVHEVRDRVQSRLRQRRERKVFASGTKDSVPDHLAKELTVRLGERLRRILPGCQDEQLLRMAERWPTLRLFATDDATVRADAILGGSIDLLGTTVSTKKPIDWYADPRSAYRWNQDFYAEIPIYELPDGVDVKYVWELNRHQYCVDLARAWRLTGRDEYVIRLCEILVDWIDKNPLYSGVNWTSGLEVGVRSISWIWSLAMSMDWSGWRESDLDHIVRSLVDHATYLDSHLSHYASPYNHLIGEATALYILGLTLDGHPQAEGWRARAHGVLEEHGPLQFYEDGFSVEQATGYHFFTLGFLSQAIAVSRVMDDLLPALEQSLPTAFRAGASLMQPNGQWPVIGDVDSARSIPTGYEEFWDFRSLLSVGVTLFGLKDLKSDSTQPGEELFWMCGVEGLDAWENLDSAPTNSATHLPDSGYAVVRHENSVDDTWFLFDSGPLGEGVFHDSTPSVSHGHCDVLSVLFRRQGKPVLVDPGTISYAGPREWVDYFRDAPAHNTIAVEGLPAAKQPSRLAWANVYSRPSLEVNLDSEVWLCRGVLRLGKEASITRSILGLRNQGLWITDYVSLDRPRKISWFWHTMDEPTSFDEKQGDNSNVWSVADARLSVNACDLELTSTVQSRIKDSPVGCVSPGYGQQSAGYRISLCTQPTERAFVTTYVGTNERNYSVRCGREQLKSTEKLPDHDAPTADIIWQFEIDGQVEAVAGGVSDSSVPKNWRMLEGVGDWCAATTLADCGSSRREQIATCTATPQ